MKAVQQVNKNGAVVLGRDVVLNNKQIKSLLAKHFTTVTGSNPFVVSVQGVHYTLCVKNVTYLGHPHPPHKKRIQIPGSWQRILLNPNSHLLGLYTFGGQHLFVSFDTKKYRNNKLNNSSAHVHVIDLLNAVRYDRFQKIDARGNIITVFKEKLLIKTLTESSLGKKIPLIPELQVIHDGTATLPLHWDGRGSYDEMLKAQFPDALQPEWPGFYFEFSFSNFLKFNKKYRSICSYIKNKSKGTLDFDLSFNGVFLGDLKSHMIGSSLLGNDKRSMKSALKKYGKLWYVILSYTREKDSDHEFVTTKHWNKLLSTHRGASKDPMSYSSKMKYSVDLVDLVVAEVNSFNSKDLKDFNQGHNTRGEPRATKLLIDRRDLDNFVIYRKTFVRE